MAAEVKVYDFDKPVVSDKDFVAVKERYLSQVVRKRKGQSYNIGVLNACRWIHDESCDKGKTTGKIAYTNMQNIYYGKGYSPQKQRLAIFHELDHLRKGDQHRNYLSSGHVSNSVREPGRVVIKRPDRTIFFEEAFAHANSYSFFKDAYTTGNPAEDKKVFKEIDDFYVGSPYKFNVDVTSKLTGLLGIKLDKFEKLVVKRNKTGDKELDKMFFKLTGDKNFFRKIESKLNYYGTYIYQANEGKKPDMASTQKANEFKKEVDAYITYAQKVKDGFEKKPNFFQRLFGNYAKQKRAIMACFGQKPNYAESFYAMLENDDGIDGYVYAGKPMHMPDVYKSQAYGSPSEDDYDEYIGPDHPSPEAVVEETVTVEEVSEPDGLEEEEEAEAEKEA